MKHMQTPSQTFIAVRFDTTGSVDLKPLDVVKKFSIVVTPVEKLYRKIVMRFSGSCNYTLLPIKRSVGKTASFGIGTFCR